MIRSKEVLDLTSEWGERTNTWRIEAVIHDGEWYDKKKWMRVAKVKEDELNQWIEQNKDELIMSEDGLSYRVSFENLIDWYKKENIDVSTMLVPKNFPPKLWGNTTEAEVFERAPRRRVGTVSFEVEDTELLNKCKSILDGIGLVIPDKLHRYKAFGLSAAYMKNALIKELTENEYKSLDIKTRNSIMQRELFDFSNDWLVGALQFYIDYANTALKASQSTIEIYLPEKEDQHSQKVTWIILALKKFDETKGVPFSGYLTSVLRHWPYDLPDEYLGKELSDFQRKRSRAVTKATQELGYEEGKQVPDEVLAGILEMEMSEYIDLSERHNNWSKTMWATTLTWDDSPNEKGGQIVGYEEPIEKDIQKVSDISNATVEAAIETEDWESAYLMLDSIDCEDVDSNLYETLSDEFIQAFASELT